MGNNSSSTAGEVFGKYDAERAEHNFRSIIEEFQPKEEVRKEVAARRPSMLQKLCNWLTS